MVDHSFNGWGVTAVDSLDTMLLMGLEDEFARAIPMVTSTNFSLPAVCPFPVLYVSRLTATEYRCTFLRNGHSLSGWSFVRLRTVHGQCFARQSRRTRDQAFARLQYIQRIPPICSRHLQVRRVHLCSHSPAIDISFSSSRLPKLLLISSSLAEIASFQMEYTYLGKITGKKAHVDRVSIMLLPFLT